MDERSGSRVNSKEKETGITIHYLNEKFDDGEIIFQKSIPVDETDTPESLSEKVHELEYEWYPKIIEQLLDFIIFSILRFRIVESIIDRPFERLLSCIFKLAEKNQADSNQSCKSFPPFQKCLSSVMYNS